MARLDGKVAFITGGARGQGRSHAVLMAEQGADIITLDLCGTIGSIEYPLATAEDLDETVRLVDKTGRRIVARQADVRDFDSVAAVLQDGLNELGRLDFVVANAGIMPTLGDRGRQRQAFYDAIDVMLTGVFHTCEAAIPTLIEQDEGGAIVITSSSAGLKAMAPSRELAMAGFMGYGAAKHGVVGLMRAYANSLAPHQIRCNSVHPGGVNTPMVVNDGFSQFMDEHPDAGSSFMNPMQVSLLDPSDISNAIIFLCSEEGRYITGVTLPVDAGFCNK
jgi:SDR family mycofactocin-dependent oxidoreductase